MGRPIKPGSWHERLVWLFVLGLVVGSVGMVVDKRRSKHARHNATHLITREEAIVYNYRPALDAASTLCLHLEGLLRRAQ